MGSRQGYVTASHQGIASDVLPTPERKSSFQEKGTHLPPETRPAGWCPAAQIHAPGSRGTLAHPEPASREGSALPMDYLGLAQVGTDSFHRCYEQG